MNDIGIQVAIIFALVLLNAAFAGTEMAMVTLRDAQVHRLERRSRAGATLARLARDPNRYLSTIQIGITLAGFLASASAAVTLSAPLQESLAFLGGAAQGTAVILVTVLLSYVTLVLGELVPKRIAMRQAERWATATAPALAFLSTAARPAVWLLGVSTNVVVRLFGIDPHERREEVTAEDLQTMVATQESMSEQHRRIVSGAFEVADRRLRDVMRPRPEVFVLDAESPAPEALEQLVESGHTRAPVVEGGDLDRLVGVIHMQALVGRTKQTTGELAGELALFPEGARVLPVLSELQRRHIQLAVVVDEFGAAAGLVSVEDLVEEIVGEIYDEMDKDVEQIVAEADGSMLVPGRFPVHDLVDLDIDEVPLGSYTTVAGLILDRLGRMPRSAGEKVVVAGHTFEVIEVNDRAIERVRILPRRQAQPNS